MSDTRHVAVSGDGASTEHRPRRVNNYMKRAARQAAVRYETDTHDLHPQPAKAAREELEVELADAVKAEIASESTNTSTFKATERPPLKFKGTVVVSAPPDEEQEDEEGEDVNESAAPVEKASSKKAKAETEPVTHTKVSDDTPKSFPVAIKKQKRIAKKSAASSHDERHLSVKTDEPSERATSPHAEAPKRRTLLQRGGVIGMTRQAVTVPTPPLHTPATHSNDELSVEEGEGVSWFTVAAVSCFAASVVFVGLLGADVTVVSTPNGSEFEYRFSIGQLLNNLSDLGTSLFAQTASSR